MTKNDPRPLVPYLRQSRAKERTISIDEQRRDIHAYDAGAPLAAEIVGEDLADGGMGQAEAASDRGEWEMLFTIKAAIAREQWKRHRANWGAFTAAERRDVLGGFLDRIDVGRGASSNLASHLRIVWSDGSIAHDEQGVRKAAA